MRRHSRSLMTRRGAVTLLLSTYSATFSLFFMRRAHAFRSLGAFWKRKQGFVSSVGKGYAMGGDDGAGGSSMAKIASYSFSTNTAAEIAATLTALKFANGSFNSATLGYSVSGQTSRLSSSGVTSHINGLRFSDEAITTPSAGLHASWHAGDGNSENKGYLLGGMSGSGSCLNTISALAYSTESSSTLAATLVLSRSQSSGVNSRTQGVSVLLGGCDGNTSSTRYTEIDGVTHSTDALYNPSTSLSQARSDMSPVNTDQAGYCMAGSNGSACTDALKWAFSSGTLMSVSSALGTGGVADGGINSSAVGLFFPSSTVNGMRFSDETAYSTGTSLTGVRGRVGGACQSGGYL